jgi:histidinol-phosphate aminotransferase
MPNMSTPQRLQPASSWSMQFAECRHDRTFSKIYGLGGPAPRLGLWAGASSSTCSTACAAVQRQRGAIAGAGIAALKDADHVERSKAHNARWLPWFVSEVTRIGLHRYPSVGNFLLVRFPTDAEAQCRCRR